MHGMSIRVWVVNLLCVLVQVLVLLHVPQTFLCSVVPQCKNLRHYRDYVEMSQKSLGQLKKSKVEAPSFKKFLEVRTYVWQDYRLFEHTLPLCTYVHTYIQMYVQNMDTVFAYCVFI